MQKFKRRQRHSLPFGLFLAVVAALLLPGAVAPRANAGPTDYWTFEEPQGVLINQPLAFNDNHDNPTLTLNVASGDQPGGFQPLAPLATFTWTGGGAPSVDWSNAANWGGVAPTSSNTTDLFFAGTTNTGTAGTPLNQNIAVPMLINSITFSAGGGAFFLGGSALRFDGGASNSITQSSASAESIANNFVAPVTNTTDIITLTGNGTGVVTLSGVISPGTGLREYAIVKSGTSTFVLSGTNLYDGGTTVNGGTLLVNNSAGSGTGTGAVTVNNAGTTLGGTGTISGAVSVGAGANIAPGNGGNNTGTLTTGALTLASGSNFRVDINGTTAGTFDQISVATGGVTITGSNLAVTVGTTLALNQTFTILNKVAVGAITGTFAGIPQGATVTGSDGTVFQVSYTGGDGNDIVLTVIQAAVPEPSTWMGGTLAIAGLAFTQRRRLRKLIARRCPVGS
jgi:autotransporter-associated beta strand protein